MTDPQKNARLTSAHYAAVAERLAPDTEAYFEHVERTIGLRDGGRRRVEAKYNVADPNTHVSGSLVYLTASEAERATDGSIVWNYGPNKGQPIGRAEYAKRKSAMVKEGRS